MKPRQDLMSRLCDCERNMYERIRTMKYNEHKRRRAVREYQRLAIACLVSLVAGAAMMSCKANFKVMRPVEKPNNVIEIKQP